MHHTLLLIATAAAALGALFFSILSLSLRGFSRTRLEQRLERRHREHWLKPTVDHAEELVFITAVCRLLCNILTLIFVLAMFQESALSTWARYLATFLITGTVTLFSSVALPQTIASHTAELAISVCAGFLYWLRLIFRPLLAINAAMNSLAKRAAGDDGEEAEQEKIEEQIITAVEAGEKEGLVDPAEREMIESVIKFRDTTVGQIMTARHEIVALESTATLTEIKQEIERTGLSRLPVYEGTLDHITGVLYARDLLSYIGQSVETFDIKVATRPAIYVPETKPLKDLLRDFRLLKIHMAIVLDEYGGTAGIVTIEDVLEELVGEISDEHEPHEEAMVQKIDDLTWEADARIELGELNRLLSLDLPEDADYQTLGGFVSTTVGRIPEKGAAFVHHGARFTVLAAEPQRVIRVKIELPHPAG